VQRNPTKPANLDPIAADILEELHRAPEAKHFVLGGYFALSHYLDYRRTHDIDAWWDEGGRTESAVQAARDALATVAKRRGLDLQERERGDVLYFVLQDPASHQSVFSFQVAERTRQLAQPLASPYPPIMIEAFDDNVASKMTALVSRGAPRDLRDIHVIVTSGLSTVSEAWQLWQKKNPDKSLTAAKAEVMRSLDALEARRPLRSLPEKEAEEAARVREWYRSEFAVVK